MGLLIDGVWNEADRRQAADGSYQRTESPWRRFVTADGRSGFKAETGRYHLFVNVGCPWAYRTVLYRKLKGLEDAISISFVRPAAGPEGWMFDDRHRDDLFGSTNLHEVYTRADSSFKGRVTVPVLWDKREQTIVNNESSEIIRMLNSEFDAFARSDRDFYPTALRADIDQWNDLIYPNVNNGVYRCGFASTQSAYEAAFDALFETLDRLDDRLGETRFLTGDQATEADWRLLPTLQRFDLAYHGLFRCNERRLVDYKHLWAYARDLHQHEGVAETVDFEAFKQIYWSRSGVIPKGPTMDWMAPAGRG